MAKPTFLLNDVSQRVITLLKADGTPLYPLAVGQKGSTYDDDAGWLGVATHAEGDAFAAGDGVVVIAGLDETDDSIFRPVLVDADGRLIAAVSPAGGALTNRSGSITAGATAQTVAAANPSRKYFFFQNISDTDMWLNFGTAAVADQPSIKIFANGGGFVMEASFVSTESISVICATTGKKFVAKEA